MPEVFDDIRPIEAETSTNTDIITGCIDNPKEELLKDFGYLHDAHLFVPEQKMYICGNISVHTSEYSFDVERGCSLAMATSFKKFQGFYLSIGNDAYSLQKRRVGPQYEIYTSTPSHETSSLIEAVRLESHEKPTEVIYTNSEEYLKIATIFHIFSDITRKYRSNY